MIRKDVVHPHRPHPRVNARDGQFALFQQQLGKGQFRMRLVLYNRRLAQGLCRHELDGPHIAFGKHEVLAPIGGGTSVRPMMASP